MTAPTAKPTPNADSRFTTRSGIEVRDCYGTDTHGKPGEFPFTRGVQKDMYRGRLWTMRQYAGFGTAKESNKRYRYLLAQGTTGLSVAFDLPTQLGLDPDHARARGEVGKVGVSISTLDEMRTLFSGIDLSKVSTSMTINASAAVLLAFYVVLGDEQGVARGDLRGTIQNDILKEYIARGNYIYPPAGALRLTTDLFSWCAKHTPKWNPISISGYHIREAGSTAPEELAFTFGDAIAYVEAGLKSGLTVDQFAGQLSFFFNVHNEFFEEIAKFRAARRIWARIMRERFQARDPRSQMLRFHCQTAGSTLTAQQPENNAIRVAYQAMAAVLGGTQSLHTNSRDEALGLPTEASATLALRTQQVLAYETGVTRTVDPLAGSVFVEELTDEIERRTLALLADIDAHGGMVKCIESGVIQTWILNSAFSDQRKIDRGEIPVVGVNVFKNAGAANGSRRASDAKIPVLKIPPAVERDARSRVAAYRGKRSAQSAQDALRSLKDTARSSENRQQNLMDAIIACVQARATLGEICDSLRTVFGEYAGYRGI